MGGFAVFALFLERKYREGLCDERGLVLNNEIRAGNLEEVFRDRFYSLVFGSA